MYPELMTKDASKSPLMGLLKIDQIAFISRTDEDTAAIKKQLRLTDANWVQDEVIAEGYVRGARQPGEPRGDSRNLARLEFNYDMGIELEILRYLDGHNYADESGVPSCQICHIGAHIEKGMEGKVPAPLQEWMVASPIIQQVRTHSHSNPFLVTTGRRYKYTIYDTRPLLGVHFKVIERI